MRLQRSASSVAGRRGQPQGELHLRFYEAVAVSQNSFSAYIAFVLLLRLLLLLLLLRLLLLLLLPLLLLLLLRLLLLLLLLLRLLLLFLRLDDRLSLGCRERDERCPSGLHLPKWSSRKPTEHSGFSLTTETRFMFFGLHSGVPPL